MPPEIVDRNDARVVHLGDDLSLPFETLLGVGAQLRGGDQLDRHLAIETGIVRAVDHPHSAASQLRGDLVPIRQLLADHLPCPLDGCLSSSSPSTDVDSMPSRNDCPSLGLCGRADGFYNLGRTGAIVPAELTRSIWIDTTIPGTARGQACDPRLADASKISNEHAGGGSRTRMGLWPEMG